MKTRSLPVVLLLAVAMFSPEGRGQSSSWSSNRSIAPHLFADNKAQNVGDALTIVIVESSRASKSNNTKTNQELDWSGKITRVLFPEWLRHTTRNTDGTKNQYMPEWAWGKKRDFQGGGTINNSETIQARITVQVIDVLPNGNLVVEGTRSVSVADEEQKMVLTGIVRPTDIQPDNTVLSSYVADARILFYGKGTLSNNQRKGLITRFLEWVNLF